MGAITQLTIGEIDLSAVYDPDDRAPVPLDVAVCLPELGGAPMLPSPIWTVKKLRGAIARGELRSMRSGRALYVTRIGIREFIERCHVNANHHDSGSSPNDTMPTVASATPRLGSSSTGESVVALDAARASILGLRKRSKST